MYVEECSTYGGSPDFSRILCYENYNPNHDPFNERDGGRTSYGNYAYADEESLPYLYALAGRYTSSDLYPTTYGN